MNSLANLNVRIFADGADKAGMLEMHKNPLIKGFTTNPTLMRKAGISDYEGFAKDILSIIKDKPISFEVFSDDFTEMKYQAQKIATWGENVYVKIPVCNTKGESSVDLIYELARAGIKQNITAIMTLDQVKSVVPMLAGGPPACISIFAGRIADTGCDPLPIMKSALNILQPFKQIELIWASPRELLNIFQASEIHCHIITVTNDLLKKISIVGKDLYEYSLETVQMFYKDAVAAGFKIAAMQEREKING